MRRSYSPEIETQAVEKYLAGESVRSISESMGVSTGYVSNCVENFTSNLEKTTIEALHDFYTIIRKKGLQPSNAFIGFEIFSTMTTYDLDVSTIHSFVSSVLSFAHKNNLSPEQLIEICKKISAIQADAAVAIDTLEKHCETLVAKEKTLSNKIKENTVKHKETESFLKSLLEKKNFTLTKLEHVDNAVSFFEKIGIYDENLDSMIRLFENIKNQNYDVSKIIKFLNQHNSLDLDLQERRQELSLIKGKISESEKNYGDLSLRHENLSLRHESMSKSIKSVEILAQKGVTSNSLFAWQKIFNFYDLDVSEFSKEMASVGNSTKIIRNLDRKKSKLEKEISSLENKKAFLEKNVNNLKSEISNGTEFGKKTLTEITNHTVSQINDALRISKNSLNDIVDQSRSQNSQIQKQYEDYFSNLIIKFEVLLKQSHQAEYLRGQMKALMPLFDLLNGKFDPPLSIPQVVVILDKLYVNIKGTVLDKFSLSSDIKRLREKLLDSISHV